MKIIAWNINGLRSLLKTQNLDKLLKEEPDIICFGETKLSCLSTELNTGIVSRHDINDELMERTENKYNIYWSLCSIKKGYSGTAILSKQKPNKVDYGLLYKKKQIDNEGRVITLEFNDYYLIHVYTPNSGRALERLEERTNKWDKAFSKYIKKLQKEKDVIVCGDLNVAHEDIDIHNPKTNHRTTGFTDEERKSFSEILKDNKLIDTYRYLHPKEKEYSFWSYLKSSRAKDIGWRIDYFLISENLIKKIEESSILTKIMGSDHAPIKMVLNLKKNI